MSKTNKAARGRRAPRTRPRDFSRSSREARHLRHNPLIEEEGDTEGELALDLEDDGDDEEAGPPGR